MLERRHIRVLVPTSRTLYYNDKGRERGITAETARAFEQYLKKQGVSNYLRQQQGKRIRALKDAGADADVQRFKGVDFSPANRALFAFASYNAGPGNTAKMLKEAEKRGLDPDKWFNNVELVAAEKIGIETTTYVRNIFDCCTSYTLSLEAAQERDKARDKAGRQVIRKQRWPPRRASDHGHQRQPGEGHRARPGRALWRTPDGQGQEQVVGHWREMQGDRDAHVDPLCHQDQGSQTDQHVDEGADADHVAPQQE